VSKFADTWLSRSDFLLSEAACLWARREPYWPLRPLSSEAVIFDSLREAVAHGELDASGGDPHNPRVTREALRRFSADRLELPRFLRSAHELRGWMLPAGYGGGSKCP
jgi:hypothetical protein